MRTFEVSFKEIFVYLLRRWKAIAAFALVAAILPVLYNYSLVIRNETEKQAVLQQESADILVSRENSIKIEESSQTTQLIFGFHITYLESLNLQGADLAWKTGEILNTLVPHYLAYAQTAPLFDLYAAINPGSIDEPTLRDLVNVKQTAQGLITISVNAMKNFDNKQAATILFKYLESKVDIIAQSVGTHSLINYGMNTSKIQTASENVDDTGVEKNNSFKSSSAPNYLSLALFGFMIGLVVSVLTAVCYYLLKLPLQIPEQIQRQLGIRYLGGIIRKKHMSLGDRLAGTLRMAKEKQAMGIIAANLREFAGNRKQILITGTISEILIKEFSEKIAEEFRKDDISIIYGADINSSVDTINKTSICDAIILVEQLDVSKFRNVYHENERIDMSGKEIFGYVLY